MSAIDRLQGLVSSVAIKAPVACATTANITLNGEQTIDGVLTAASRVLVKNQTDATTNGIYLSDTGNWTRDVDFNGTRDCVQGTLVVVVSGTVSGATVYQLTTASPVIGTSTLTFAVAGAAALALASAYMRASVFPATTAAAARTALAAAGPGDNNAFTGANDFTGGSIAVPTAAASDSTTKAASTAFVQGLTTTTAAAAHGFVNALRNGTFLSWPSGFTISIGTAGSGSGTIGANGWAVLPTGATVSVAQVTGTGLSAWGMKVTGAASVTDVTIGQRIESFDAAPLAGNTCTFQIRVFNSTGGSITPTLATRYAGSADTWGSPVADLVVTNLQACANGVWTTVSYTFAVSANAVNGYEIKVDFGNNFSTNGKFVTVAGADLRPTPGVTIGLNAAPPAIEVPDTGKEMTRNARYLQASYDNGFNIANATRNGLTSIGLDAAGAAFGGAIQFPVRMRAGPTMLLWDGAGAANKGSLYASGAWTDGVSTTAVLSAGQTSAIITCAAPTASPVMTHYTAYADFW